MIRLYFYVEGQSEQLFAQRVLREHLAPFGVMVEGSVLAATRKRHGVVYRGGGRRYPPLRNDLVRFLKQQHKLDIRVTTMFDLYGLYGDFPGMSEADKFRHLPEERVRKLEEALACDLADSRLIPHIQLHEFESMLFVNLDAFAYYFDDCNAQIKALFADADPLLTTPERINDGETTAPSKRIAKYFPRYPALKPDAAVEIASVIGLAGIRDKCPHFNDWLKTLEQLDREKGE